MAKITTIDFCRYISYILSSSLLRSLDIHRIIGCVATFNKDIIGREPASSHLLSQFTIEVLTAALCDACPPLFTTRVSYNYSVRVIFGCLRRENSHYSYFNSVNIPHSSITYWGSKFLVWRIILLLWKKFCLFNANRAEIMCFVCSNKNQFELIQKFAALKFKMTFLVFDSWQKRWFLHFTKEIRCVLTDCSDNKRLLSKTSSILVTESLNFTW